MQTKKLALTSLNNTQYPNKEIECEVIEDMGIFVQSQIFSGVKPKQAQKTAEVIARVGVVGEQVDTRPRVARDGNIYVIGETKGTVKVEGSMIVTNPDGEEYIVKPEAFAKKYAVTAKDGVYSPIAEPIKYIILDKDIVFMSPWGTEMHGVAGAALNITSYDDIYAIQNEAFSKTYETRELPKHKESDSQK